MTTDSLIPRLTVSQLVDAVERAEAGTVAALAAIAQVEEDLNVAFGISADLAARIRISDSSYHRLSSAEDAVTEIRRQTWRFLSQRLEVRGMMSTSRWEAFERKISGRDGAEIPPVTHEQVGALLASLGSQLDEMLREKVEEVFNWLRPRGEASKLKTNSQFEVPPKVILTWVVEPQNRYWTGWAVHHRAEQELIALESVFAALDGKGPIVKSGWSAISAVIKARGFDGSGEVPYFRFRCFRNGRMHLTFTRPDLLARFNAIAGGKRLRSSPADATHHQRSA